MSVTCLAVLLLAALTPSPGITADGTPSLGTLYLHTNQHGDAMMATNNAGNAVAIADNRPWGDRGPRTRGMEQVRRTFDGWEYDDATGLLYAGARYYDPRLGRFLSVDPAGQAVYLANRDAPLEFVDPDGRGWYRMLAADETFAFRFIAERHRYERVPGKEPVRVEHDQEPFGDDVYFYHPEGEANNRLPSFDASFMNGVLRGGIVVADQWRGLALAYIRAYRVPAERQKEVLQAVKSWANSHTRQMTRFRSSLQPSGTWPRPSSHSRGTALSQTVRSVPSREDVGLPWRWSAVSNETVMPGRENARVAQYSQWMLSVRQPLTGPGRLEPGSRKRSWQEAFGTYADTEPSGESEYSSDTETESTSNLEIPYHGPLRP